jgi:hypothetical protein
VTQQYLTGELSLRLAQLEEIASNDVCIREVVDLRYEAEARPPAALTSLVVRALELTDSLCWDALARGDTMQLARGAAIAADLCEFGVCAGLLDDA